jgi:alpha-glucosidase
MKKLLVITLVISFSGVSAQELSSPDGHLWISVETGVKLALSAKYDDVVVLHPSLIGMRIRGVSERWEVTRRKTEKKDEMIVPAVAEKRKQIRDHYNQITLGFKNKLSLELRAYDDGFSYRFVSAIKDSLIVEKEIASYQLPEKTTFYGGAVKKRENADIFHTSFEEPYLIKPTDSISDELLFFSPVMIAYAGGMKAIITESDLESYPGMFLRFGEERTLNGVQAGYPVETTLMPGEFPQEVVTKRADHIARTAGKRTFPWRVMMIATKDTQLPSNDMVYRLGAPSRISDPTWIKPGKGTDEWIIGINLFNVPFKAGLNTATYKYYIDFAKRFGFERIMMDAGWSDNSDLLKINPNINMDEIAAHAKVQGISLSMWTLASTLDRQLKPALAQFKKWGVTFIMTDFMDRDDQKMVDFYHRTAKACAEQEIMIMYHGAFKPAGFSRTWPNAITREGVLGSEYNIWSDKANPDHDLLLPFIRMTAGPMDYEPGFLDNARKDTFRPISEKVMSMGTRMHQAAMFVVYESPIQLFSGNPSQGLLEPEFMEMIGSIPTVWDETIVLDGQVGEYIITARKKGNNWYVGGMTNWTGRTVDVDLSFLGDGEYTALIATDGVNADRYPSDYRIVKGKRPDNGKMKIEMAKGGGFVIIFSR